MVLWLNNYKVETETQFWLIMNLYCKANHNTTTRGRRRQTKNCYYTTNN